MKDLEWLTTTLDCGDNSCHFKDPTKPGGMRTNGGCRCLDLLDVGKRRFVLKMFHELVKIQEEQE